MKNKLLKFAVLLTILFGYPCLVGMDDTTKQEKTTKAAKAAEAAEAAKAEQRKSKQIPKPEEQVPGRPTPPKRTVSPQKEAEVNTQIKDLQQRLEDATGEDLKGIGTDIKKLLETTGTMTEGQEKQLKDIQGEHTKKVGELKTAASQIVGQAKKSLTEALTLTPKQESDLIKANELTASIEELKKTKPVGEGALLKRNKKIDELGKQRKAILDQDPAVKARYLAGAKATEVGIMQDEGVKEVQQSYTFIQKQVQILKQHKGLAGVGAVLLALLGGLGGIGIGVGEGESKDKDQIATPGQVGGDETPDAVIPPNPYVEPAPDNDSFKQDLLIVANAFNKTEDKFKEAVERGDYYNSKFRITLGQVTVGGKTQDVIIEYNFGLGAAGDVGTPLTPIEVNIIPNEIDGFAISVDKLLAQIKPDSQEMATLLLNPNAAFIFLLKVMLLNKSVLKDPTFKDHFERIREILTQTAMLYARLILTPANANPSTQSLLSTVPLPIQNYLSTTMTKMHPELIKAAQTAQQDNPAIMDAILTIRTDIAEYTERTGAINETLLPWIKEGLSYSDQKFITHAILRQVADLGDKLPKNAVENKNELSSRLSGIVSLAKDALEKMEALTDFEGKNITLQKALSSLQTLQNGGKVALSKPRLGDPKSGVQDISLVSAIDIYLHQFQILQNTKFSGDYGFKQSDLLLGKSETVDMILAILLRGVKLVTEANETLLKTKEVSIELRKQGGTFTVNPSSEFDKLIKQPTEAVAAAQTAVADAVKNLRAAPKNPENKKAYDAARGKFDEAVKAMETALQKFRNAYPPYLPIKLSDGSEKTTLEFLKAALQIARKVGHKDVLDPKMFSEIYSAFATTLGLSVEMVYDMSMSTK